MRQITSSMKRFFSLSCTVLLGMLCMLFLGGCTSLKSDINNLDSAGFHANLKSNAFSTNGKKAAYFEGRIYYLSSELGTQGIYSMDTTGKDMRVEFPVGDIRAINIQPDGVYYSGFVGTTENAHGLYRQFHLLIRKNGDHDEVDFLKTVGYTHSYLDNNVWDFYISVNGVVVICFMDNDNHVGARLYYLEGFRENKAIPVADYTIVNKNVDIKYATFNKRIFGLGKLDNMFFLSDVFRIEKYSPGETMILGDTIIDLDSDHYIIKNMIDRSIGYNDNNSDYLRWFCRGSSDGFILASVHGLEKYDLATNTITSIVSFEQPESVYAQIDCKDNILMFTQLLRETYHKDYYYSRELKQTRALAESLYRVDPETGAKQLLLTLEYNNAFLYADANAAVTGGDKTISIYDISGEKAVQLRTIAIENNIVDYSNKVDTAGGWVFLYRFNEQTQRDELIEKVFIGS